MKKFRVIGCGAIGSLYAAHLAHVAEIPAFARRDDMLTLSKNATRALSKNQSS